MKYPPVYGGTESTCKNKTGTGGWWRSPADTELYPAYQLDRNNGCINLGYGTDPDHMRWAPIGCCFVAALIRRLR